MSAYADTPTETIRTWLSAAVQARQDLMVRPTSASGRDGRRVSYEQRLSDMNAYINELRSEIVSRESSQSGGPIVIAF